MKKTFSKEEFDSLDYIDFEVTWSKRCDYGFAIYSDHEGKFWAFNGTHDYNWGTEVDEPYEGTQVKLTKVVKEVEEWLEVGN